MFVRLFSPAQHHSIRATYIHFKKITLSFFHSPSSPLHPPPAYYVHFHASSAPQLLHAVVDGICRGAQPRVTDFDKVRCGEGVAILVDDVAIVLLINALDAAGC